MAFKRHPGYERKKSRKGKIYPAKSIDVGVCMLNFLYLYAKRIPGPNGRLPMEDECPKVPGIMLMRMIKYFMPFFPEEYEKVRGERLTPWILEQRLHKMYYTWEEKGKTYTGRGTEHPENHETLKACLKRTSELFDRGTPLTLEEAKEAGTVPSKSKKLF